MTGEGGLVKGTSKEGTGRGMDGAREIIIKGRRKRAEEGLSEEGGSTGVIGRETSREVS